VPRPPEIIERTNTVEVPVVQEHVVNRVVYIRREVPLQKKPQARFTGSRENAKNTATPQYRSLTDLDTSASITGNGYLTQANLTALQPTKEMKVRIIKGVKINEK
jgi:hypothetical protein